MTNSILSKLPAIAMGVMLSVSSLGSAYAATKNSPHPRIKTYERCMDKAGGVVPDMRDCAWAEKARLDDRLFAEIKKIRRQDGTPQVADPKAFMDELVKYRKRYVWTHHDLGWTDGPSHL